MNQKLDRLLRATKPLMAALLSSIIVLSPDSHGFYSTLDNGEMIQEGHYRLGLNTQFITTGDDGINIAARMDGRIEEDLGWRAVLGIGTTDFFAGGFVKWVPFPDVDNQPAIGVLAGVLYGHYESENDLSLRLHPFVSKRFEVTFGVLNPYVSLPIGVRSYDGETDIPVQLALGSELRPSGLENVSFWAELGFDVNDAFTYFTLGATLGFNEEEGIQLK